MKDGQLKALDFKPSNLSFGMKNSLLNVLIMLLTFITLHFHLYFRNLNGIIYQENIEGKVK